jgi:hypothetical protein
MKCIKTQIPVSAGDMQCIRTGSHSYLYLWQTRSTFEIAHKVTHIYCFILLNDLYQDNAKTEKQQLPFITNKNKRYDTNLQSTCNNKDKLRKVTAQWHEIL